MNILALLHRGTPGRQASLLAATNAGRTAFAASLDHLIELGVVEKNPGHGHPLRPEFRLTEQGVVIGQIAHRIVSIVPSDQEFALLRRSWTVPVLALTGAPQRFSDLRMKLLPITDRALSGTLQKLEHQDWIRREVITTARTPFPVYNAINRGQDIARVINGP
ncbi:winged helix-turn-helix transcriptional regulator [Roseibium sp. TrichSKD4]|uniref:winged helix-turn-helix transcriptional regulator n=1 Tax=Roseibium sp. TrichSKD4 TaxID=744980 RepID=UPI001AD90463|nr:winged helix-turn-helix transcriptional regulator [Roseibium sp. TrichSKD4]